MNFHHPFYPPVLPAFRALALALALGAFTPLALSSTALAQDDALIGDVEGAEFRAYPIAIPNFRAPSSAPSHVRNAAIAMALVLRNDLKLSGAFRVLDPKSYIDTDGVVLSTVKFDDWLNIDASGLVKAMVRPAKQGLSVDVHVYEVAEAREGLSRKYTLATLDKRERRRLAHQISDDIYRHYTGEPGVFRTQIAVVKKVAGQKHIFVMDMDGDNAHRITKGGTLNLLPSWSPSGDKVLFTSYRFDNPDLFEVSSQGGKVKRLSSRPGLNTGGRVSPDNRSIALTLSRDGNSEIYLLNRDGSMKKRLTKSWGIDTSPSWSPDGKQLVFVSSRAGNPHLYLMSKGGSKPTRLFYEGTYNQTPSFSPRGNVIAFTARDEFNRFDIFLFDLKKKRIIRLTQDQGNNEDPTFSPNGRLVAFTSTRTGSRQVFITNLDGKYQQQITFGGNHSSPTWGPFVAKAGVAKRGDKKTP